MAEIVTTVRYRDAARLPRGKAISCAACKCIDDELAMQQRGSRVPASSRPAQQLAGKGRP